MKLAKLSPKDRHRLTECLTGANHVYREARRQIRQKSPTLYRKILQKYREAREETPHEFSLGQYLHACAFGKPKCANCNKVIYSKVFTPKVRFCSRECADQSPLVVEKRKQTTRRRYGNSDVNKVPEIIEKIRRSNLEKYGHPNAAQSRKIKNKIKKTFRERYGVDHWTQAFDGKTITGHLRRAEVQRKAAKTRLKNYGVDNLFKCEKVKKKIKRTNLKRYGFENPAQSIEIKEKIRQGQYRRYGKGQWNSKTEDWRRMTEKTNLERYGHAHPRVLSAAKETVLDRFGVKHVLQGYEPQVLRWLNTKKSVVSVNSDSRTFKVQYTHLGKRRTYYPDLLVTRNDGREHIIEVKSLYTLSSPESSAKFKSATRECRKMGRTFWVFVLVKKNSQPIRVKNPTSRSQVVRQVQATMTSPSVR